MTKEEQIRIAHNIKKMREVRGYDQQYMADQLGIKQNTYSRIEKGESTLTEERIEQLAKALQTTAEAIKKADVERMVFHIQHQEGHSGNISIYNAADEIVKAFNAITQPINEELKQMKEEMKSLKKEVVSLRHQNKVQKK